MFKELSLKFEVLVLVPCMLGLLAFEFEALGSNPININSLARN